jgi:hypothetical protein
MSVTHSVTNLSSAVSGQTALEIYDKIDVHSRRHIYKWMSSLEKNLLPPVLELGVGLLTAVVVHIDYIYVFFKIQEA